MATETAAATKAERTYAASRGPEGAQILVWEDGKRRRLDPRLDLRSHSPSGLEWGYEGSGPSQLALALLADLLGSEKEALEEHPAFMRRAVAALPRDGWSLTWSEAFALRLAARTNPCGSGGHGPQGNYGPSRGAGDQGRQANYGRSFKEGA